MDSSGFRTNSFAELKKTAQRMQINLAFNPVVIVMWHTIVQQFMTFIKLMYFISGDENTFRIIVER